jgi:phage tail-like protein
MAKTWDLEKLYLDSVVSPPTNWAGEGDPPSGNPTKLDQVAPALYGSETWQMKDYPSVISGSVTWVEEIDFSVTIVSEMDFDYVGTAPLDLMPLVPTKFRQSQEMIDLIATLSSVTSQWMGQIRSLPELINSDSCPSDYLKYLASNIGVSFDAAWDDALIRQVIKDASSVYKYKGSFEGNKYVLNGDWLKVRDLWAYPINQPAPHDYATLRLAYESADYHHIQCPGWCRDRVQEDSPRSCVLSTRY